VESQTGPALISPQQTKIPALFAASKVACPVLYVDAEKTHIDHIRSFEMAHPYLQQHEVYCLATGIVKDAHWQYIPDA
jgi:hypothetical protein